MGSFELLGDHRFRRELASFAAELLALHGNPGKARVALVGAQSVVDYVSEHRLSPLLFADGAANSSRREKPDPSFLSKMEGMAHSCDYTVCVAPLYFPAKIAGAVKKTFVKMWGEDAVIPDRVSTASYALLCAGLLKPGGRAAVLLSGNALCSSYEAPIWGFLTERGLVDEVAYLPSSGDGEELAVVLLGSRGGTPMVRDLHQRASKGLVSSLDNRDCLLRAYKETSAEPCENGVLAPLRICPDSAQQLDAIAECVISGRSLSSSDKKAIEEGTSCGAFLANCTDIDDDGRFVPSIGSIRLCGSASQKPERYLQPGDIIMPKNGDKTNACCLLHHYPTGLVPGLNTYVIRLKGEVNLPRSRAFTAWLASPHGAAAMRPFESADSKRTISRQDLLRIKAPHFDDADVCKEICRALDQLVLMKRELASDLESLYRETIIPQ